MSARDVCTSIAITTIRKAHPIPLPTSYDMSQCARAHVFVVVRSVDHDRTWAVRMCEHGQYTPVLKACVRVTVAINTKKRQLLQTLCIFSN